MSNNRRKIEKCLAGEENHVTVHTGVVTVHTMCDQQRISPF